MEKDSHDKNTTNQTLVNNVINIFTQEGGLIYIALVLALYHFTNRYELTIRHIVYIE